MLEGVCGEQPAERVAQESHALGLDTVVGDDARVQLVFDEAEERGRSSQAVEYRGGAKDLVELVRQRSFRGQVAGAQGAGARGVRVADADEHHLGHSRADQIDLEQAGDLGRHSERDVGVQHVNQLVGLLTGPVAGRKADRDEEVVTDVGRAHHEGFGIVELEGARFGAPGLALLARRGAGTT